MSGRVTEVCISLRQSRHAGWHTRAFKETQICMWRHTNTSLHSGDSRDLSKLVYHSVLCPDVLCFLNATFLFWPPFHESSWRKCVRLQEPGYCVSSIEEYSQKHLESNSFCHLSCTLFLPFVLKQNPLSSWSLHLFSSPGFSFRPCSFSPSTPPLLSDPFLPILLHCETCSRASAVFPCLFVCPRHDHSKAFPALLHPSLWICRSTSNPVAT